MEFTEIISLKSWSLEGTCRSYLSCTIRGRPTDKPNGDAVNRRWLLESKEVILYVQRPDCSSWPGKGSNTVQFWESKIGIQRIVGKSTSWSHDVSANWVDLFLARAETSRDQRAFADYSQYG